MGYHNETSLKDLSKEPGIEGLPTKAKVAFIGALKAEEKGDRNLAEQKLAEAVAAEEESRNPLRELLLRTKK